MRSASLTILASLSLAMLAVLAFGYVCLLYLDLSYVSATPAGKMVGGVGAYAFGGQFVIMRGQFEYPATFKRPLGLHVTPLYDFKCPLERAWLGHFRIDRYSQSQTSKSVELICPAWFAALPCTLAPIAWLCRRHRRRHSPHSETRGFPIDQTLPPAPIVSSV